MKPRGRRVALWAGGMGIVALVAACFALKDRLREEWWLYKLEHGDEEGKATAARRLGEMRSVRAVRPLLHELKRESLVGNVIHHEWQQPLDVGIFVVIPEKAYRYQQPLVQIGEGALLELVRDLSEADPLYSSLCTQCIWLIAEAEGLTTGLTTPPFYEPQSCAPILRLISNDATRPHELREVASQAVKKIESDDADSPR